MKRNKKQLEQILRDLANLIPEVQILNGGLEALMSQEKDLDRILVELVKLGIAIDILQKEVSSIIA